MDKLDRQIGEKLKELRERKGLTMRDVAAKIDIDPSYISKIEKGKAPSLDKLKKLADLYGTTIASLFGDEIENAPELENAGVRWIRFIGEMERKNLTPEEIQKLLETLKILNKL